MIVYRVQAATDDGWINQFEPTLHAARKTHRALVEVYGGDRVRIDKVEVDINREGICLALNHAEASHLNWTGDGRCD